MVSDSSHNCFQTFACKLFKWHSNGSSVAAIYLMTAMALDRVVAIKYPYTHCTYRLKKVATVIGTMRLPT